MKSKDLTLYYHMKEGQAFTKIQNYSEVRWLSLGNSLKSIQGQWLCLNMFFKHQLKKKKEQRTQVNKRPNIIFREYDFTI